MVVLVMDVQKHLTQMNLNKYDEFVENTKSIIKTARENNVEVIYVQHDNGVGSGFSEGDESFEIDPEFSPLKDEKRFIKKVSCAFCGTNLEKYLKSKNVHTIVIMGLLTNFCMDVTIKSAFEKGYRVIVPEGTNTTFGSEYMDKGATCKYYNECIWNGRFAECMPVPNAIAEVINNGD